MKNRESEFLQIILQNEIIAETLDRSNELNIPNWFIGAGCLAQTVWNFQSGQVLELLNGIDH